MVAVAAMVLAVQVMAQGTSKRIVVVSLEDRKLALVEDGQVKKVYTVAVGKPGIAVEMRAATRLGVADGVTIAPTVGVWVGVDLG